MIFFTADPHIGHKNILKYEPKSRPYKTIDEHDADIVRRRNEVVTNQDHVWILGDMFCCKSKTYAKQIIKCLMGRKHLLCGNHDEWPLQWYRDNGFDSAERLEPGQTRIFWGGGEVEINMCHYPYRSGMLKYLWNFIFDTKLIRFQDRHPIDNGKILLHGHIHSRRAFVGKQVNVGWDIWHVPVSEEGLSMCFEKEWHPAWIRKMKRLNRIQS